MGTPRKRLTLLEQRIDPTIKRWHCIRRYQDETEAEAIAKYEAENGLIGPDDGSILRVIINKFGPSPREA